MAGRRGTARSGEPVAAGHATATDAQREPRRRAWLWTGVDMLALGVFWLYFFFPIVVTRDHLIPYDLIDQHYMYQVAVHRALLDGDIPWWSPHILGGYPLAADPIAAVFYPPNVLMHLLTRDAFLPYLRLELQLALHYLWAAWGAYALARALSSSRAGALIAALVFAFGGFFAWHVPHLSPVSSLSWLPWVLLCLYQAVRLRSLLWTGFGATAFGALALAGHALTIVLAGYLVAGIALGLAAWGWRHSAAHWRGAIVPLAIGGAIVALGLTLAAVQLLPALELSGQTERASFSWADASASSFRAGWLVTAVVPNFFSHYGDGTFWASGDPAETNAYAGLLPLFLAALALVAARAEHRRIVWTVAALTALALLVALGSQTWLYRAMFEVLPGIDRVRRPGNAMAGVHLGMGVLAAFGVAALQGCDRERARVLLARLGRWLAGSAVALVAALVGGYAVYVLVVDGSRAEWRAVLDNLVVALLLVGVTYTLLRLRRVERVPPQALLAGLVLLVALDIGMANAHKVFEHHALRPDSYIGSDWAGNPADDTVRVIRAMLEADARRPRLLPARGAGSIWDNGPLVWEIESVRGYSVLWPSRHRELYQLAADYPGTQAYNMLGGRFVVSIEPIEDVYPGRDTSSFTLEREGFYRIYENHGAWARAWVAHEVIVTDGRPLDVMIEREGSLASVVVLEEPPPDDWHPGTTGAESRVEIVGYEATRVEIEAVMDAPGFVVLGDTWYPGWRATVDGEPARVYRANHAFRAVWLGEGRHTIVMEYQPAQWAVSLGCTALAAVCIAACIVIGLVRSPLRPLPRSLRSYAGS